MNKTATQIAFEVLEKLSGENNAFAGSVLQTRNSFKPLSSTRNQNKGVGLAPIGGKGAGGGSGGVPAPAAGSTM